MNIDAAKAIAATRQDLKIQVRGPLEAGLSGATVYLVDFEHKGEKRLGVLKLTSQKKAEREVQGDTRARESWLRPYLPDDLILLSGVGSNPWGLLITLARDRLENCETLHTVFRESFVYGKSIVLPGLLHIYSAEAMREWPNSQYSQLYAQFKTCAGDYLPNNWQNTWEEEGLPSRSITTFLFEEIDFTLPNPIAYLADVALWPNDHKFSVSIPTVQSHGDLNSRNILCPSPSKAAALASTLDAGKWDVTQVLSIIDTPFCRPLPFTFDPAFLATWLDFLLPRFDSRANRSAIIRAYTAIAESIRTEHLPLNIPSECVKYVECVSLISESLCKTQPRMAEDIKKSFLISLAAAALWRAIKVVTGKTSEKRSDAIRLTCLSAIMLKEIVGSASTGKETAPLVINHQGANGTPWTPAAAHLSEILIRQKNRRKLILVLGRELATITSIPSDAQKSDGNEPSTASLSKEAESALRNIAKLPAIAIVDWSHDSRQRNLIASAIGSPYYIKPILPATDNPEWTGSSAIYYIHIRGANDNISYIATSAPERNTARVRLRPALSRFAANHAADVSVLYAGVSFDELRETHMFLQEFWEKSLESTYIGNNPTPDLLAFLKEWDMRLAAATTQDFVLACAELPAPASATAGTDARIIRVGDMARADDGTLVAKQGDMYRASIETDDFEAISRAGYVITEPDVVTAPTLNRDPKQFFIGHPIELGEIRAGIVVERDKFNEYIKIVRDELHARHLQSVVIPSRPGAGASTAIKWVAYTLASRDSVPAIVLSCGGQVAFEAIERLYRIVGRSIVAVADPQYVGSDELAGLVARCSPARYPVVFLSSVRVLKRVWNETPPLLEIALSVREKDDFVKRLAQYCPTAPISRLSRSNTTSMFLLTLEAFGAENVRIERYVKSLVDEATSEQRTLLSIVAIFSRYAHRSCSNEFLQVVTEAGGDSIHNALLPFNQLLVLEDNDCWSCRHDLLSKPILQTLLAGSFDEQYRYELSRFVSGLLEICGRNSAGKEIAADYFWSLLNPHTEAELGQGGERPQQSRFISGEDGLPTAANRYGVFSKAANVFPDDVNIISHFGKYLAEDENKFDEADYYLIRAFELAENNEAIPHMIGKRFFDEIRMLINANPAKDRPQAISDTIVNLSEQAHHWFEKARARNLSSEFGYTTAIQLNIRLIRDEFQKMGVNGAFENPSVLKSDRIVRLLSDSDSLVNDGQRYIVPRPDARRVFNMARDRLHELRGDLTTAIACFEKHVNTASKVSRMSAQLQLARLLHERGELLWVRNQATKARKDFERAEKLLFEALQDPNLRKRNIRLWFDCARHASHWRRNDFLDRLHQLYEYDEANLDAAFLLMCLYFCEAIETRSLESWRRYEEFQRISSRLSSNLGIRRYVREWMVDVRVGMGSSSNNEYRVFPHHYFDSLERGHTAHKVATDVRVVLEGAVAQIVSSTEGYIEIRPVGFRLFFRPRAGNSAFYKSDAEKRTPVEFLVGFNYEKAEAYDVARGGPS